MNALTFQAHVLSISGGFGDQQKRAHLHFEGGFVVLTKQLDDLFLGQELEVTIAPRQDVLVTCEHGDEVASAGAGPVPDSQVGDGAQPEISPTPVAACKWCNQGIWLELVPMPNGQEIRGHYAGHAFHECKNVDGD